ncbi:hypothetical protein DTO217A2_8052 [Paecilomyces variotii]|nr:hypothetical protein DTO217A2_8052 [Paecilomyces variotii]
MPSHEACSTALHRLVLSHPLYAIWTRRQQIQVIGRDSALHFPHQAYSFLLKSNISKEVECLDESAFTIPTTEKSALQLWHRYIKTISRDSSKCYLF